jgi:hypothetical protein
MTFSRATEYVGSQRFLSDMLLGKKSSNEENKDNGFRRINQK